MYLFHIVLANCILPAALSRQGDNTNVSSSPSYFPLPPFPFCSPKNSWENVPQPKLTSARECLSSSFWTSSETHGLPSQIYRYAMREREREWDREWQRERACRCIQEWLNHNQRSVPLLTSKWQRSSLFSANSATLPIYLILIPLSKTKPALTRPSTWPHSHIPSMHDVLERSTVYRYGIQLNTIPHLYHHTGHSLASVSK